VELHSEMKLQGIFPPIATPFDHNGDIYPAKVRHNVEKWNRTALSGYVVMGSTGESVMLTAGREVHVWELVAKHAAPEKAADRRHRHGGVRETVALTNRAADMGYKAAMVRTPHYYKNLINRADAQMLYFRAVADQSRIPLIIYNWPQATGVDIPVEAVVALSEHPNVIAIKESSGNLEKVMQMIREVKHGFQVLVGSAPTLWPSLLMGACGRHPGLRQRRAVFGDRHLGGVPNARGGRRPGLAEPHRPPLGAGDHQVRHPRPQVRHGPERLLRRPAAPPAGGAHARSQEGNRRGVQGSEG
jgi:dihydrodipicolinate synthase/N-acetylneuraminate lyase